MLVSRVLSMLSSVIFLLLCYVTILIYMRDDLGRSTLSRFIKLWKHFLGPIPFFFVFAFPFLFASISEFEVAQSNNTPPFFLGRVVVIALVAAYNAYKFQKHILYRRSLSARITLRFYVASFGSVALSVIYLVACHTVPQFH